MDRMGKLRKTAYLATVAITAMLYGKARFESSRYEPQCETIPGVCIYADQPPAKSRVEVNKWEDSFRNTILRRTLFLSYPDGDKKIDARYEPGSRKPYRLVYGEDKKYQMHYTEEPVQILVGPKNRLLVKDHDLGYFDYGTHLKAYTGFKEISWRPKPFEPGCVPEKTMSDSVCPKPFKLSCVRSENDSACSPSYRNGTIVNACIIEKRLSQLAEKSNPRWRCRLENARIELVQKDLSDEKRWWKHVFAEALIDEFESSSKNLEMPKHNLWRGWNWILAGLFSPLVFNLVAWSIRAGKKFRSWRTRRRGEIMEEEKEMRKRLEKEYLDKLDGLYEKVNKAKTMEECREIHDEFMAMSDKIIAEDPEFYKSHREENLRFCDALDGKVEMLGGPKRIYRRSFGCDKMPDKKRLEREYSEKLDGLYERINKATTTKECREIRDEFGLLRDKIMKEDPELHTNLREENLRFLDQVNGKIEVLGGPKAPYRR